MGMVWKTINIDIPTIIITKLEKNIFVLKILKLINGNWVFFSIKIKRINEIIAMIIKGKIWYIVEK